MKNIIIILYFYLLQLDLVDFCDDLHDEGERCKAPPQCATQGTCKNGLVCKNSSGDYCTWSDRPTCYCRKA